MLLELESGVLAALRVPNLVALFIALAAACWTTGGRLQRAAGVALGIAAVLPSWLLPEQHPFVRGVSGLAAFACTMRVVDLRVGSWPLSERLAHVASFVDTRRLVRAPPRFEARVIAVGLSWLACAVGGYGWLRVQPAGGPTPSYLTRWAATLLLVYGAVSAGYALVRAAYAAVGFQTGPLHLAPLLSRSVDEFWGERWARPISVWLRETFFRPCAKRRRPVLGWLLAFAVSGAFHAYVVWVALGFVRGLAMAACMFAFFLAQACAVAFERAVSLRKWPARRGRVWTASLTLASAPLFLEPLARVVAS